MYPLQALYVCEQCFGPLEVAYDRIARADIREGTSIHIERENPSGLPTSHIDVDIAVHLSRNLAVHFTDADAGGGPAALDGKGHVQMTVRVEARVAGGREAAPESGGGR